MNIYTIIVPVLGLVWMWFCLYKLNKQIKTACENQPFYKKPAITFIVITHSGYARDILISGCFCLVGTLLFMGVTGMVIGLGASAVVSPIMWLTKAFERKQQVAP